MGKAPRSRGVLNMFEKLEISDSSFSFSLFCYQPLSSLRADKVFLFFFFSFLTCSCLLNLVLSSFSFSTLGPNFLLIHLCVFHTSS